MGLAVERIEYRDFRSYESFALEELGPLTVIVGPNAVGKTNLIEGIQLTTAMTSFRSPRPEHLVRTGAERGSVKTLICGDDRRLEVELICGEGARTYRLNGKKRRASSLAGMLPSVLFCPDDLGLVKGPQAPRRAQADTLGSQLSSNYRAVRLDYERIVRQKNRSLKDEAPVDYLRSLNEVQATVGAQFYRLRAQMLAGLAPYLSDFYRRIAGGREEATLAYVPSWLRSELDLEAEPHLAPASREEAREALAAAMERALPEERARRRALFGPHVDRIEFYLDGRNAQTFASQGQQRSLVLSYKMAEVELIRDRLDQAPVLLLDDVMSELDDARRRALLEQIVRSSQTFVTATNAEYFDPALISQARIVELRERGA